MPDMSSLTELLANGQDILVYAAIALVTLIGVFKCLLPLCSTTHAVRRAIADLQRDAGQQTGERPVWQESRFMGKRLRGCWLRFLQNAEQLDRRGLPCNVEDYINDETVTYGPGNASLAELIPNLLTSLGILGTFMGMMRGLSSLGFENAENILSGIPTLLSGMQFAFGTSVAGISCSLVFNMLNRIAQGSSFRAIDAFTESFTQLAMHRPLDNDVQLICQNQDRNHMLSGLNDLPAQAADAMGRSVSRAMQPVTESMDQFIAGTTRNQIEGVNRIVANFVSQMNASLGNQLRNLGDTLAEISRRQQNQQERMDASLNASGAMLEDATRLHSLTKDVMDRFESFSRELGETRLHDESFTQSTAALLEKLRSTQEQQMHVIRQIGDYQQLLRQSADAMADAENNRAAAEAQKASDILERMEALLQSMDHDSTAGEKAEV